MGIDIQQTDFTEQDYQIFATRLEESLTAFNQLLAEPGFGVGGATFGAELEMYIVDNQGSPLGINKEIQNALNDPLLTLELNRYNLEYNFTPVRLNDHCFTKTQNEALAAIEKINAAAKQWGGKVLPIGILPTLKQSDTGYQAMTDTPRYHALTKQLSSIRGGPFTVDIQGEDHIKLAMEDVTLEGACTSFQIHLRVSPQNFADTYNALQLVTPLVLALGANSPTLFGHRLWHETRVPLFKQAIDCRRPDPQHPSPARVNYGHGWLRQGAAELFAESVLLYPPILPVVSTENPLSTLAQGELPSLHELRLQQGSVWLWNRPVYDPSAGGHLRIEMRALPAGPSVVDMVANAALLIGLTELMRKNINDLLPAIPFDYCIRNFYRAAEKGLNAELMWPSVTQSQPQYLRVGDILKTLLPRVPAQLNEMGFPKADYLPLMDVIGERLLNGRTGAQWQLESLTALELRLSKSDALHEMLRLYQIYSGQNLPVAQWPIAE